jgi:hypothetical protein
MFTLGWLSGCSLEEKNSRDIDTSNARVAKLETNIGLQDMRDLAKPPSLEEDGEVTASLPQSRGLNLEPKTSLFKEQLRDSDDRFDRLEQAVQGVRDDFDKMAPSIARLVSTEKDIQDLLAQLRTLLESENEPQPLTGVGATMEEKAEVPSVETVEAEAPPPVSQPPPAPPPAISSSGGASIRVADHGDKTRIVFETAQKQDFTASFDAGEQLVLVETSGSFPENANSVVKRGSKRVSEANVNTQDGGKTVLAIVTKGISRATPVSVISPNSANPKYRYFFDLIP